MKNPFSHFRSIPYQKKEIPLDRIIQAKQESVDRILEGYLRLVDEEAKQLVWLVEQSRVAKAYEAAEQNIKEIQYDQDDIEDFCAKLDSADKIPYVISGPAGIYVSALINNAKEEVIKLTLLDYERIFHFLGFRLPEGKALFLKGNVGDFIGVKLSGGRLVVEGSAGNWCGAGMQKGEIHITQHVGEKTGEWMRGGEIHVDGVIRSIGKTRFGGKIYRRGKIVVPQHVSEVF